jgi:hypothetical protein
VKSRYVLYFLLALLPALLQTEQPPTTQWDWIRWAGLGLYQALLAVKALQSKPNDTQQ